MFLAPPVLDLGCIRTLDLHLACVLHLLCWILFVFVHWIFDCVVSVAILWIKPLENPFCRSANIVVYFLWFRRILFWNLAADLDFHASFYGAPRSTSANPCFCCPIGQKNSPLPLNDFRVAPVPAPWMHQIRNVLYFLANPSAHPLLNWGPVTMLTLALDWMHCKYLGSDKLLYGGVLHVIIYKLLSGTAQENMVQTWNLLKTNTTL